MSKFVDPYYQGQSKVNYILDEKSGQIQKAPAHGWEPEFEATQRAWDEINEDLNNTLKLVHARKLSPLSYFMKKRLMEPKLLAAESGVCLLFVHRHLKSFSAWKNLNTQTKQKYAKALDMSLEQFEVYPQPPCCSQENKAPHV